MSGGGGYEKSSAFRSSYTSADSDADRERLRRERAERVESSRSSVGEKVNKPRPTHDAEYDSTAVQLEITEFPPDTTDVYVILIDNSGSNRAVAQKMQTSTNYLKANLNLIDRKARYLFVYVSDHQDGHRMWQPINHIKPNDEGERVLTSTLRQIKDASGQDAPEAFECTLLQACQINFGNVPVANRHLILVTDVTGHHMGMEKLTSDDGCPDQVDWHKTLDKIDVIFGSFELIGSGNDVEVDKLQEQFISYKHPELLHQNFISLVHIREQEYRLGIISNAFLFLIARHCGLQTLEGFLARIYEKWLEDPIFGHDTDKRAREAIIRFAKYIPHESMEDLINMMCNILVTDHRDEIEKLIRQSEKTF